MSANGEGNCVNKIIASDNEPRSTDTVGAEVVKLFSPGR